MCVPKGLDPQSTTRQFPHLVAYADVRDVGVAARDWPQLNFVINHSAFRFVVANGPRAGRSSSRRGASTG